MGLDQYFFARHKTAKTTFVDRKGREHEVPVDITLGTWRKHNDLHRYIEETIYDGDDEFNCISVVLSVPQMETIRSLSQKEALPTGQPGFFFGHTRPEDHERTVEIMKMAIRLAKENSRLVFPSVNEKAEPYFDYDTCEWEFVYDSWW